MQETDENPPLVPVLQTLPREKEEQQRSEPKTIVSDIPAGNDNTGYTPRSEATPAARRDKESIDARHYGRCIAV